MLRVFCSHDKLLSSIFDFLEASVLLDDQGTDALEYVGMAAIVTPALARASGIIKFEIIGAYDLIKFW